jgi:enoyl-CoA hydratase/carnithine racemase
MMDMMLTGRTYDAAEGYAIGLSQYLVESGAGLGKALELAAHMAGNAPLTNFAVMHALPRIADGDRQAGLLMESLMSAIAQDDEEAKLRMRAFLDKRGPKAMRS